MEKLKIIVGGNIGLFPTGGATWDYIQYPLGLKLMGHDVFYIEDTRQYPIFQKKKSEWNDASGCVNYLSSVMKYFDMSESWAYRDIASGKTFGATEDKIKQFCKSADIFINISCSTFMRDEYLNIPKRILIDSDPMFTQIQYAKEISDESESALWTTKTMLENHNFLFTFGENINKESCLIPRFDFKWIETRQPVCLDYWGKKFKHDGSFTTIMNWSGRKKLEYNNTEWGQKDVEFLNLKNIPEKFADLKFDAVINAPLNPQSRFDMEELRSLGWNLIDPSAVENIHTYQNFISNSSAEFSVAKETYVKSKSGWFSCRSACYLSAFKPVITQDTGWSENLPTGSGLFSFSNSEEAIESLHSVKENYKLHSDAAREIAEEYFDSKKVLSKLLNTLN